MIEKGVDVAGSIGKEGHETKIPDYIGRGLEEASLEAVSGNRVEQLLDLRCYQSQLKLKQGSQ